MVELILLVSFYIAGVYILFQKMDVPFPFFLSIAVTPALITVFLQYALLIAPGIDMLFIKILFIGVAVICICYIRINVSMMKGIGFHWDEIVLVFLCSVIFLVINPQIRSFDPMNYVLIGKEIFQSSSLLEYPFVELGRSSSLFSWFAHPLMLPLSYSVLFIFDASQFVPYVSSLYFILTIVFVYKILKKECGYTVAVASAFILFFTPQFFEVARDGFTGPMRMFFFTAVVYYFFSLDAKRSFFQGLLTGLAMNTHLIGIVILPYAFFMHWKHNEYKIKLKHFIAFSMPVLFFGGFIYVNNLLKFHSLDSTKYLVSFYPDIASDFINMIHSQYGILDIKSRLINGYFAPFMRVDYFSLSFVTVFFIIILSGLKLHRNKFFISSTVLLIVYGVMHFNPSEMNGFIRGPRYVLTILPVLIVLAGTLITSVRTKRLYVMCSLISVCVALYCSGSVFKQQPIAYEAMKNYINQNVPDKSRILTFRFPEVGYFNDKQVAVSEMDPRIADIYKTEEIGECLSRLQKHGIGYILFGFYATPFETETCIRQLFEIPCLLKREFSTEHYFLYSINFESYNPDLITGENVFVWNPGDTDKMVLYKNGKTHSDLTLNQGEDMAKIKVTGENPNSVFMFANAPSWESGAGYIKVRPGALLKIQMTLDIQTRDINVVPAVAQYDSSGKRISLINGCVINGTGQKNITIQYKTSYPYIQSERIKLKDNCATVAVGLHFWSNGGEIGVKYVSIEE